MSHPTKQQYSFHFDPSANAWICSIHGNVDLVDFKPCWGFCEDGYIDAHNEDPINADIGEFITPCPTCNGEGGWMVCGLCNRDE